MSDELVVSSLGAELQRLQCHHLDVDLLLAEELDCSQTNRGRSEGFVGGAVMRQHWQVSSWDVLGPSVAHLPSA